MREIRLTESERSTALAVGVVIARERTDHPWQEYRWSPVEIVIGRPDLRTGQVISESATRIDYYAGIANIELHRKETPAYIVNLENTPPSVYVVLRDADEDDAGNNDLPYVVEAVTVSPFEAQDFLDTGEEIVEPLDMPPSLLAWLERFVAEHHEEEEFIKRKRDRLDISQEKFGQEPLEIIRRRKRPQ